MAPIDLDPNPADGHSPDRTIDLAGAVADAVRALNYATLAGDTGLPYPSTVYDVIGRLQAGAAGMDQLFRQLAARVVDIAAEQDLRVSHGEFIGDPSAAVRDAVESLESVRQAAGVLHSALGYAHSALSPLGVRIPLDDPDE